VVAGKEVRVIRSLVIPPELGESIEVRLLDWIRAEGDSVAAGDALLEFETDKAIVLVTAAQSGFLRKCLFAAGDWMKPGDSAALLSDRVDEALPEPGTSAHDLMLVTFEVT
jgi:pyruvate/2-oxoglutarate dehydrogenase complex dihydrolipoamide acyltransferase (E2) component